MWQKAKIVKVFDADQEYMVGRLLWLKAERPVTIEGAWTDDGYPTFPEPCFVSHLYRLSDRTPDGRAFALITAETVELLPLFEQDISPVLLSEWARVTRE